MVLKVAYALSRPGGVNQTRIDGYDTNACTVSSFALSTESCYNRSK